MSRRCVSSPVNHNVHLSALYAILTVVIEDSDLLDGPLANSNWPYSPVGASVSEYATFIQIIW